MMKRLLLFVVLFMFCPVAAASRDRGDFIPASVAHYKFEDNTDSNTVIDSKSYSNGTSIRNTSLMHVAGQVGGALEFNGTADYVDTGQTFESTFQDSFTVSLWCKPDDGVKDIVQYLVAVDDTGVFSDFYIYISIFGKLTSTYESDRTAMLVDVPCFVNGENDWKMITVSAINLSDTTGRIDLYIDGKLAKTGAVYNDIIFADYFTTLSPYIGHLNTQTGSTKFFAGSLDDFMIFNKALTADEIEALYESVKGVRRDR